MLQSAGCTALYAYVPCRHLSSSVSVLILCRRMYFPSGVPIHSPFYDLPCAFKYSLLSYPAGVLLHPGWRECSGTYVPRSNFILHILPTQRHSRRIHVSLHPSTCARRRALRYVRRTGLASDWCKLHRLYGALACGGIVRFVHILIFPPLRNRLLPSFSSIHPSTFSLGHYIYTQLTQFISQGNIAQLRRRTYAP